MSLMVFHWPAVDPIALSSVRYWQGHDVSIKEKALKDSMETDGRVTGKLLHQRLEMVMYPLWADPRDHRRHVVSKEDHSELPTSRLTYGTYSSGDSRKEFPL